MLDPLTHYVEYPDLYAGPKPEIENIETGYGKLTSGLVTIAGGGRSYGVLGEGNAHFENGKYVDVDDMGVRLRKESVVRHSCDNTYLMVTIVPKTDSVVGSDRVAI